MDSSEKAYFKKFAFKRDNKNNESYLEIFNILDKQTEFDIDKLKTSKKLNKSHQSNIHAALNNLFKTICQVLTEYRKDKGNNQKLFHMISEFELFKEKKLYDLASKKYSQIEEFVEERRMYGFIPYVYQLRGAELQNNTISSTSDLEKYFAKLDRSKRDLDINLDINKLSLRLEQIFHRNGGVVKKSASNDEEADELIKFIEDILSRAEHNFVFTSVLANNRFVVQMIFGRLDNLKNQIQDYFDYFDENINEEYRDNELGDTLITLKNYAVVSVYLDYQDIVNEAVKRLKIVYDKYQKDGPKQKLKFRLDHINIINLALNNIPHPAISNVEDFLEHMEEIFVNKAQYSEAVLSCMMALVRINRLDQALSISDEFVKAAHNDRVRDQYISVRLLRSIIWYKQGLFDLYQSEINSIYRKLKQSDSFPFQLEIIKQIKKIEKSSPLAKNDELIQEVISSCDEVLEKKQGSQMMKAIELKTIALFALS